MKKTIALAALVAVSGLAQADTLVIDISGVNSWGFQGDPQNETMNILVGLANIGNISNIAWDVTLTTEAPSWFEEFTMGFAGNSVVVSPGDGDAFGGSFMNYTGNTNTNINLGASGMLDIEFYEQFFDDIAGGIDTFVEAGSSITLTGTNFVPTPGSLAVLGLGGLVAGRRRR